MRVTRRRSGHARRRRRSRFSPAAFARRHAHALAVSLHHLGRRPAATVMTVCVLGVALALPAGLLLGARNLERLGAGWLAPDAATVFLHPGLDPGAAQTLQKELAGHPAVRRATLVDPEQALEEFRVRSGLGEALDALDGNPLPPVIALVLTDSVDDRAALLEDLRQRDAVDFVQYDRLWAERFQGLVALAHRTTWVIGAGLLLAAFLTVGNTIRLEIGSRRDEIEVTRLVGGSDAFIRRPFLYAGLWYGLAAGLLAAGLVSLALLLLQGPLDRLGAAYGTALRLDGLGGGELLRLVAVSALLGWLGSRLAVARHLARIQPR